MVGKENDIQGRKQKKLHTHQKITGFDDAMKFSESRVTLGDAYYWLPICFRNEVSKTIHIFFH